MTRKGRRTRVKAPWRRERAADVPNSHPDSWSRIGTIQDDYHAAACRHAAHVLRALAEDLVNEALDAQVNSGVREALAAKARHWTEAAVALEGQ